MGPRWAQTPQSTGTGALLRQEGAAPEQGLLQGLRVAQARPGLPLWPRLLPAGQLGTPQLLSHGNPLQYSCLENATDRGAWRAAIQAVAKSPTRLKRLSTHTAPLRPSARSRAPLHSGSLCGQRGVSEGQSRTPLSLIPSQVLPLADKQAKKAELSLVFSGSFLPSKDVTGTMWGGMPPRNPKCLLLQRRRQRRLTRYHPRQRRRRVAALSSGGHVRRVPREGRARQVSA